MPSPSGSIQRLQPLGGLRPSSLPKTTPYTCAACGEEFLSYPGMRDGWPPHGDGLPPCCADPVCRTYLQDLGLMRRWMEERGITEFLDAKGQHYRLTGHEALARRVEEKRRFQQTAQAGWR